MAILWADGFDDYDYDATGDAVQGEADAYVDSATSVAAGTGRRGGGALVIGSGDSYTKGHANLSEIFVAFAFNPTSLGASTKDLFQTLSGATLQTSLGLNADGSVSVYRGAFFGTLLGTTAAGLISAGVWNHIQLRVVYSDTVGVVQVRINGSGSNALSLTSQDTNNGGSNIATAIKLQWSGSGSFVSIDDLVVWDTTGSIANTWLGDVRVDSLLPNGNGASSQFTGSDSNSTDNYLLVDAASPNTSDYVQSSTVTHKDLYDVASLPHTPVSIFGVVATVAALKDDAGTRSIKLDCKSSSSSAASGDKALSTSRTRYAHNFETDPATSAAWTASGVNAAQFGLEVSV